MLLSFCLFVIISAVLNTSMLHQHQLPRQRLTWRLTRWRLLARYVCSFFLIILYSTNENFRYLFELLPSTTTICHVTTISQRKKPKRRQTLTSLGRRYIFFSHAIFHLLMKFLDTCSSHWQRRLTGDITTTRHDRSTTSMGLSSTTTKWTRHHASTTISTCHRPQNNNNNHQHY